MSFFCAFGCQHTLFQRNQNTKKIKIYKETKYEKKEVEGPNCFYVA
jgi:type III secretory pathway component EscU